MTIKKPDDGSFRLYGTKLPKPDGEKMTDAVNAVSDSIKADASARSFRDAIKGIYKDHAKDITVEKIDYNAAGNIIDDEEEDKEIAEARYEITLNDLIFVGQSFDDVTIKMGSSNADITINF